MLGKGTHFQVILHQSTQNTANLPLQTRKKNPWNFFIVHVTFAPAIILLTWVHMQTFQFLWNQ